MNLTRKPLVTAALLAALSLGAIAQTTTPPPAAPAAEAHGQHDPARMQEHRARMQERIAKRQAELKQKLQLTATQEPAWNSFSNALRPSGDMKRPDREALARMTTPDRIDQMRALRTQRMAEMDRRGEATKAFYATLSAEQKKVFDAETVRAYGRGHRGGWHKG